MGKKPTWMPLKDNPSGTGSSKAFEAPPTVASTVPIDSYSTAAATAQQSPHQSVPQDTSFSFALQGVSDDIIPGSPPSSKENLEQPTITAQDDVQDMSADLCSSAFTREDALVQQVLDLDAHNSQLALVRSIPVEAELSAEMERLD